MVSTWVMDGMPYRVRRGHPWAHPVAVIKEGGLLMPNTGSNTCITGLYYRGWPANTGPNTCYGDFGPINLAVL